MTFSTLVITVVWIFTFVPLFIAIWNSKYLSTPKSFWGKEYHNESDLSVTVLIPARNEGRNIHKVLTALRFQSYSNYEVIVLNDRSDDDTAEVVAQFFSSDFAIRLLEGEEPPDGWLGKHWACHQLSLEAKGDYLLFVDADTILDKDAIRMAVREAAAGNCDLLTMIPSRCANNFVERSLYGFIDWAICAWLPLEIAHSSTNSYLSASYGQFMLFRKDGYFLTGGHKNIKDLAVDDFGLGRLVKSSGLRWKLMDGTSIVSALPYSNLYDTVKGISRSLSPALDYRLSLIVSISIGLMVLFYFPVLCLFMSFNEGGYFDYRSILSFGSIIQLLLSHLIIFKRFSHSLTVLPFVHVSVILMIMIACHSLFSNLFGYATWKQRNTAIRKIKF